ncbi:MAG: ABC transporter ATP-binding protein [Pseudanabaena sp.]|jgi:ABC-2 type transport system ATP-binding protein|nr:ABC transporter ATP-binding protein [Pseudanabaena sp. M090S1SP2A07QC]MCA6506292.1 ABC transporter ATP-binding protein [Pseudanabaena sp. M172S2SP2A07QC]MCA6522221.1 ABC transporter ATP-binding protein [Pseudanabaena sp. M051S1SP2A07QC]MCA6528112.1 ABC transporter ATP-binding protein [Pseudanabaena sp. M179S2SP2A07QC]MCA6531235.1 ABC transporter ATP-binding protein [Pseudanabaena sp. M125S2SP2A07QC]MCA6536873.1 ABC transporter ATP-binding protein [Pseudanabaena sp. M176S2SP2A07QC]MCA654035
MTAVPTVRTHRLTKQFDNHVAVNHLDLQIDRGEVYGLIGPNGAGKTTLIRMLAAAEEPTAGEIYINGARFLRGQNNPELKRQLGYLPDDFPLYDDLTVWDYLDYFARLYFLRDPQRSQRLYEVIELVELEQKKNELIATLSRGMKQRLSLARSIIHNPTLLLLDEPVSGLDPLARVQVRNIIKSLQQQGMTILISSHILSDLAEICTSIGIMELGHLVESSKLQALYDRSNQDQQQLLISTLGNLEDLQTALRKSEQVQEVEALSGVPSVRVQFIGSIEDCAALLKSLLEVGIPISNFHRTQETLENIFLKLGYKQTS